MSFRMSEANRGIHARSWVRRFLDYARNDTGVTKPSKETRVTNITGRSRIVRGHCPPIPSTIRMGNDTHQPITYCPRAHAHPVLSNTTGVTIPGKKNRETITDGLVRIVSGDSPPIPSTIRMGNDTHQPITHCPRAHARLATGVVVGRQQIHGFAQLVQVDKGTNANAGA